MRPDLLTHLLDQASRQHGALSTEQAQLAGATAVQLSRWTAAGRLDRSSPRCLRVPGTPDSPHHRAITAVLDAGPGAVLSHQSAAALWDLPGFSLVPHHVLAPRAGRRRRDKVPTLHQSLRIPEHHVVVLDEIPVTSPTRLVFDLASHVSDEKLARIVDTLWSRRLTTGGLLHDMLKELSSRGRPGIQRMRLVLADRGPDYRPPDSGLEARLQSVLAEAGITGFERQVNIGDDRQWLGRVDFLDPRDNLVLEVDSDRFHKALIDKAHDKRRRDAMVHAGFHILPIKQFDVWHRPWLVVDAVRSARHVACQTA